MDKLLELLQPALPAWLITPAIVVALFLLAWPSLRDIWQSIVPSARHYSAERQQLELLKLRLEIETLREKLPNFQTAVVPQSEIIHPANPKVVLSKKDRLLCGALGGLITAVGFWIVRLRLVEVMIGGDDLMVGILAIGLLSAIVVAAGAIAGLISNADRKRDAVLYGSAASLLLPLTISGFNSIRGHGHVAMMVGAVFC
jgi:hypothetical protein